MSNNLNSSIGRTIKKDTVNINGVELRRPGLDFKFKARKKPINIVTLFAWLGIIAIVLACLLAGCEPCYGEEINWDKLVSSIIEVESGGNPNAVSPQGCIGLMQINPNGALKEYIYAKEHRGQYIQDFDSERWYHIAGLSGNKCDSPIGVQLSKEQLFIKNINIRIGTWYLHRLNNHYRCKTIEQICAAYNGGPTRLRKCNYDVTKMPRETRNYVKKVMKLYNEEV